MEAHGGYLCRLEDFDVRELARLAREGLTADGGDPADCSLLISVLPQGRVLRMAYDAPHTYGRRGALWYEEHHALANSLSRQLRITVHAYVLDPEELELVVSYGDGRRVGGERVRYEDAELPDGDEDLDESTFERLKQKWPLGHLAKVYGVSRDELVRLPRCESALLELNGSAPRRRLSELLPFPAVVASGRTLRRIAR